ncbi:hypothetical protein BSR29_04255 [Boudabousia liubingyangii]|uniref:Thioesterase domain-containing protein n=1 Tax=Boudabousia liubingyangii TaxID=1921764 RepID=A0A1Q5PNB8_9ACTO|nr:hotdog fold thioesterase [Boudabousia liubingyangii]OKL49051.1 hypothetical protein BSR29_04255 [Boudabousia liubingyangii]
MENAHNSPTPPSFELGELAERLGIKIIEINESSAQATMPVAGNRQPAGFLNGGATGTLIETLASRAANQLVNPKGLIAVGAELHVSHLRPATKGHVTAVSKLVHLGKTTSLFSVEVFNEEEKLTATGTLRCNHIPKPAESGEPDRK